MYWWKDFDRDEAAEEFDVIAGLGMSLPEQQDVLWQPLPAAPESDGLEPA